MLSCGLLLCSGSLSVVLCDVFLCGFLSLCFVVGAGDQVSCGDYRVVTTGWGFVWCGIVVFAHGVRVGVHTCVYHVFADNRLSHLIN